MANPSMGSKQMARPSRSQSNNERKQQCKGLETIAHLAFSRITQGVKQNKQGRGLLAGWEV